MFTHIESQIGDRLARMRERIARAAHRAGRPSDDIRLIGVSKTHPAETVRAGIGAGILEFGENKAQELRDKASAIPGHHAGGSLIWHYIGPLQRNKAKYVAQHADWIQSIATIEIARELDKRLGVLGRSMDCLCQVNISGESSKSGIEVEHAVAFITQLSDFNHLKVRGFMAIPSFDPEPEKVRSAFSKLRTLRDQVVSETGIPLPELSMGMSHDFEVAIEEGATMIRVGTALFGRRTR